MDTFGLKNLVKEPTCLKGDTPTLIDVILTNQPRRFNSSAVFHTGISDFHALTVTSLKIHLGRQLPRVIAYRSYKRFNKTDFLDDLDTAQLDSCNINSDPNISWKHFSDTFAAVTDTHAPLKTRKIRQDQAPFMNKKLKKAIWTRKRLFKKFQSNRSNENWEKYRKQRNACVDLRRQSMRNYFSNRLQDQKSGSGRVFWQTVKPFLTNKGAHGNDTITLNENGKMIHDQSQVANIMNDFFTNVADHIGQDTDLGLTDHPSVEAIRANNPNVTKFEFQPVTPADMEKIIKKLDKKKATGCDGIPPKLIKIAHEKVAPILSQLVNTSMKEGVFPNSLKKAEIRPVYKKKDNMQKENYRPVSVLTCLSKLLEKVLALQLQIHFDGIFSESLAAFRAKYSCQDSLLSLLEHWRSALRGKEHVGAILMDLSKAFDCMPHDLLLEKFKAYGVTGKALELLRSYLHERTQRVKLGLEVSAWNFVKKGVPQGSILGPILFNVFINDLFYAIKHALLTNYADDNTLTVTNRDFIQMKMTLEAEAEMAIQWFTNNKMLANPEKFQAIYFQKKFDDFSFTVNGANIEVSEKVVLLGITFDKNLNFGLHVDQTCKRAATQLNVLKRISYCLDTKGRLAVFRCFILSHMKYCNIIWHFCGKTKTKKLEKIQERALRYVYSDYNSDYGQLLASSGFPSLELDRQRNMAIQTFKIIHSTSPPFLSDLIHVRTSGRNFRGAVTLNVPSFQTYRFGVHSFKYQAPKIWNSLPPCTRDLADLSGFRDDVRDWQGLSHNCRFCS